MKCLPLGPLGPPSKLWGVRHSFELGGTFKKSFLPPLCPLGPRFDRVQGRLPLRPFDGDELDALEQPASVASVRFDSEDFPDGVVETVCADRGEQDVLL